MQKCAKSKNVQNTTVCKTPKCAKPKSVQTKSVQDTKVCKTQKCVNPRALDGQAFCPLQFFIVNPRGLTNTPGKVTHMNSNKLKDKVKTEVPLTRDHFVCCLI